MKVLLVLPPAIADGSDLPRKIDWVRRRFAGSELVVAADETVAGQYARDLSLEIIHYSAEAAASEADIVVLVRGSEDPECADPPASLFTGRLYVQQHDGQLALQNQPFDEMEVDDIDAHVFSRIAPRRASGYYYFPYGYLSHYPGMGRVDSFGFRGDADRDGLSTRDESHKLIVVSGGLAAWSQCCFLDEAFPSVLERLLNDWSRTAGRALRFSVLNFGLFGNLVLHQTFNYLLFAERLRPDYVIAHDGYNDLVFGLLSDPWLLAEHSITYQMQFEQWAQLLHNPPGEAPPPPTQPFPVVNLPHVAVRAYLERKHQFRRVVEGAGASFVWGFQPCIFSKGELSREERQVIETRHEIYDSVHRKLERVYDQFAEQHHLPAGMTFVDCHQAFKAFDRNEHLFVDHVHTTPLGDQKLASLYFEVLRRGFEAKS